MDFIAKRMQLDVQHIPDWIHQNKYRIPYNNETINEKIIKTLWQEISCARMHLYYKHKFKGKYDNILWESFIFACQNGNPKKGILKMIHNIAPSQVMLYRRHLSHDALCPFCCEIEETTIHILRCNESNGVIRQHFCILLNKKLKGKTDKHWNIVNDIYELIIDKPTGSLQGIHWEIQQYLGWDCCIRGFLSTKWLENSRLTNLENPDFKP
jgi:hypothetical protein